MLRVDLTNRKTRVGQIAEEDLKRFIGGAGLAAEILRREIPEKIDPYSPENLVIFGTGPFQGPAIAGGAKFSIAGISPITGTFGDTAAGADWGPALKDAGYDMLVFIDPDDQHKNGFLLSWKKGGDLNGKIERNLYRYGNALHSG